MHYKDEEYVELRNENNLPVDLTGWVLRDKNDVDQTFTFAEGTELKPGSTTKVFTTLPTTSSRLKASALSGTIKVTLLNC